MMEILINSQNYEINSQNLDDLRFEILQNFEKFQLKKFGFCFDDFDKNWNDLVKILDGFAVKNANFTQNNKNLIFIKKGVMPPKEILKSMIESRNSPSLNNALKSAVIGVAGLGGLGSNIALFLARVGVKKLVLVDFDIVEPSNLNRQNYFVKHIGLYKTKALKSLISQVNPFVEVETFEVFLDEKNICEIFKDCKIICEAFDNPKSKAMIANFAPNFKDKKLILASGMAGIYDSNLIKTQKFATNVYICGDLKNGAKIGDGLMAPRVAICAGHQANLVLRLLNDLED